MNLPKLLLGVFGGVHASTHANGWNDYVHAMGGGGGSDPVGGFLLLLVAGAILVFGWLWWGKSSIKFVYVPTALGTVLLLVFDLVSKNYFLLPIGGLVVGWIVILFTLPLWGWLFDSDLPKKDDPGAE
jgi:hypothetical protein